LPSRRLVLGGGAVAALGLGAAPARMLVSSAAAEPSTRYDAASAQGRTMLAVYAAAVARMMALPASNPLSWTFQWYIHAMRNDRGSAAEIAATGGDRVLEAALWNTCEAHFDPRRLDFFLPWHRIFLWRIERIVRRLTGEAHFTMPYWDYADPAGRSLPAEFRRPGDPFWGALYRAERNLGINAGTPIDQAGDSPIDIAAMMSPVYRDSGGDAGFCANLDNAPHAAVHGDIGTARRGMGATAWAASDPIFWLHHCTVDWLWASWNRAGGRNPGDAAFLAEKFAFIDEHGRLARTACGDAMTTAALGYRYDRALARPPGSLPFAADPSPLFIEHAAARDPAAPIRLGAEATSAALAPAQGVADLDASLRDAAERGSAFILRIGGVRIERQPHVTYRVFFGPAGNATNQPGDPSYVGNLNVFGGIARDGEAPGPAPSTLPRAYSFVVSARVRQMLREGRVAGPLQARLAPTDTPAPGAAPLVGEIVLLSA
jgi:tyrosinase